MRERVQTDAAPAAIGPYSQAIKVAPVGRMLFVSGQIALCPKSGEMVGKSVSEEAEQALQNLTAVVEAGGFTLEQVVKATVYLEDMGDFADVNEVYARHFGTSIPARAAVEVAALPKGARIEIDAICAE